MTTTTGRQGIDGITRWLLLVAGLIFLMVLVGGFTRLSRAGLSIVEWDVVTGVVPPIGVDAWEESFAAYRQTPEYRLVNRGMTLAEYQEIFYIEWAHRLIGRIAGLAVVVPLVWMLWRRRMTLRRSLPYWGVAALFGVQGAIGWAMVSSGLQDRPSVSEVRLTVHLLTAVGLLALVSWMAMNRMGVAGQPATPKIRAVARWLLVALVIQLAFGGMMAGLKAGHVSNTWPLMFGTLIPAEALANAGSVWAAVTGPVGVHFIHRWFAFVVAGLALVLAGAIYRQPGSSPLLRKTAGWLTVVVAVQIVLGIAVVILGVPKWLALTHQGLGVALFVIALVAVHATRVSRVEAVAVA